MAYLHTLEDLRRRRLTTVDALYAALVAGTRVFVLSPGRKVVVAPLPPERPGKRKRHWTIMQVALKSPLELTATALVVYSGEELLARYRPEWLVPVPCFRSLEEAQRVAEEFEGIPT
jgi:hypothetical protein